MRQKEFVQTYTVADGSGANGMELRYPITTERLGEEDKSKYDADNFGAKLIESSRIYNRIKKLQDNFLADKLLYMLTNPHSERF